MRETDKDDIESSNLQLPYPRVYEVFGAGSIEANGHYVLRGEINNHPYYSKIDSEISLWYFHTSSFPSSYWCGWYISKKVLIIFIVHCIYF